MKTWTLFRIQFTDGRHWIAEAHCFGDHKKSLGSTRANSRHNVNTIFRGGKLHNATIHESQPLQVILCISGIYKDQWSFEGQV